MYCYKCGSLLSDHDFCTACGADVSLYKKIVRISNRLYNDGLEKAQVRDLTGAVGSLRQSLKIYKHNIDARNLLGLVYFEMGETVAALNEWVISKNLKSEKNVVDDYISMMQPNMGQLDTFRQTIKKYNQAYNYCLQDSQDLAIIQLKKVLSMNPKFIRAHLLLALLYFNSEQWDRAQREVARTLDIDRNNTMALSYQRELEAVMAPEETVRPSRKKSDVIRYQSDNEMIIQPVNVKEQKSGGGFHILPLLFGAAVGVAVMYFLIMPARISDVENKAKKEIAEMGNEMDGKNVTIQELEARLKVLESEKEDLEDKIEGYEGEDGTLQILDSLFDAARHYVDTEDPVTTGDMLVEVSESTDIDSMSEAFQELYHMLLSKIGPDLSKNYYNVGYTAFRNGDYNTAIDQLTKSVYYDETNRDALYSLAESYRNIEDAEHAIEYYQKVVELFPGTNQARRSQTYIESLTEPKSVN